MVNQFSYERKQKLLSSIPPCLPVCRCPPPQHPDSFLPFETGWDLGPSAAVLVPGHTRPRATKYRETVWDWKCQLAHLGKFQTQKIQRNQKNQLPLFSNYHFWGPWSKNGGWGAKAGYCAHPLHTPPPKDWANHLSHPSGETPGHTPPLSPYKEQASHPSGSKHRNILLVLRPRPLILQDPSESLAWISCLTSSQFLLMNEAENPGQ